MFKNALALVILSLSLTANAVTISYNGYSLNTTTNMVSGGGLQWLQWSQTAGQSIDTALNGYAASGWRLATNLEMATLFNAFDFGYTFLDDELRSQYQHQSNPLNSFSAENEFLELFGSTYYQGGGNDGQGDPLVYTFAFFGNDADGDGRYNLAYVRDEYLSATNQYATGWAQLYQDSWMTDYSYAEYGVALVRTSPVPVPAAVWLFGSALLGLAGKKRLAG